MQLLKLICYPDASLRVKSGPVDLEKLKEVQPLVTELTKALYAYDGLAIAAPQVGAAIRIIIVDLRPAGSHANTPPIPLVMLNPVVISRSDETVIDHEGCLSFPGVLVPVERAKRVVASFVGSDGKAVSSMAFYGQQARAVQHELEHLAGVLLIDHVEGRLRRDMITKKMAKLAKRGGPRPRRPVTL